MHRAHFSHTAGNRWPTVCFFIRIRWVTFSSFFISLDSLPAFVRRHNKVVNNTESVINGHSEQRAREKKNIEHNQPAIFLLSSRCGKTRGENDNEVPSEMRSLLQRQFFIEKFYAVTTTSCIDINDVLFHFVRFFLFFKLKGTLVYVHARPRCAHWNHDQTVQLMLFVAVYRFTCFIHENFGSILRVILVRVLLRKKVKWNFFFRFIVWNYSSMCYNNPVNFLWLQIPHPTI